MNTFPPGYVTYLTVTSTVTTPGWGWPAMILPQMDQGPLYNSINFNLPVENAANATAASILIPGFVCPSDVQPGGPFNLYSDATSTSLLMSTTPFSYAGSVGDHTAKVKNNSTTPWNGVLFPNSKIGFRNITDGASNTIAVGERAWAKVNATWVGAPNGAFFQAGTANLFPPTSTSAAVGVFNVMETRSTAAPYRG